MAKKRYHSENVRQVFADLLSCGSRALIPNDDVALRVRAQELTTRRRNERPRETRIQRHLSLRA